MCIYCVLYTCTNEDSPYDSMFVSMNHVYLTRRRVFHTFVCVYPFFRYFFEMCSRSFSLSGFVHGFPIRFVLFCCVLIRNTYLPGFHALITLYLCNGSGTFEKHHHHGRKPFPFRKDHFCYLWRAWNKKPA